MPIEFRVDTNASEVSRFMRSIWSDQVPFVTSKAINETAKLFQSFQVKHQFRLFDVRRTSFIRRSVKIKPFSTKRRLWADVSIDPPGGQAQADIIFKFESDIRKRPRDGGHIAVPIEAKRKSGNVPKNLKPRALRLQAHGGGGLVFRGERRTFLIRTNQGGLLFQRVGRGARSRTKVLFSLEDQVPISPDLNFVFNARRVVDRDFVRIFDRVFDEVIRTESLRR